jgi:hypothetical protein
LATASALEELILADDRAVCMARLHSEARKNLQDIPEGETVKLVDVGTHCRGALSQWRVDQNRRARSEG